MIRLRYIIGKEELRDIIWRSCSKAHNTMWPQHTWLMKAALLVLSAGFTGTRIISTYVPKSLMRMIGFFPLICPFIPRRGKTTNDILNEAIVIVIHWFAVFILAVEWHRVLLPRLLYKADCQNGSRINAPAAHNPAVDLSGFMAASRSRQHPRLTSAASDVVIEDFWAHEEFVRKESLKSLNVSSNELDVEETSLIHKVTIKKVNANLASL